MPKGKNVEALESVFVELGRWRTASLACCSRLIDIGAGTSCKRWHPPPAVASLDPPWRTGGLSPRSSTGSWAGCSEARASARSALGSLPCLG